MSVVNFQSWLCPVLCLSLLTLFVSGSSSCDDSGSNWNFEHNMPERRAFMVAEMTDLSSDLIHIFGGNVTLDDDYTSQLSDSLLTFHPSNQSYFMNHSVPELFRFNAWSQSAFVRNSKIYVIGAWLPYSDTGHSFAFSLDVTTQHFSKEPSLDVPASMVNGTLGESGEYFALNGACVLFDPSQQVLFVTGGLIDDGQPYEEWQTTDACSMFNFSSGLWSRLPALNSARYGHSCSLMNGDGTMNSESNTRYLYVFGGSYQSGGNSDNGTTSSGSNSASSDGIDFGTVLPSIESVCVTRHCLSTVEQYYSDQDSSSSESTADQSESDGCSCEGGLSCEYCWIDNNELLQPARIWAPAVVVECVYHQGCSDVSSQLTIISGGYSPSSLSGSGEVLNDVTAFYDIVEDQDSTLLMEPSMRLCKSGHTMVLSSNALSHSSYPICVFNDPYYLCFHSNDVSNGLIYTFGGLSDNEYYMDQVEVVNTSLLFAAEYRSQTTQSAGKSGGSGSHDGSLKYMLIIMSSLAVLFFTVAAAVCCYFHRVQARMRKSIAIERRKRKREKEKRMALMRPSHYVQMEDTPDTPTDDDSHYLLTHSKKSRSKKKSSRSRSSKKRSRHSSQDRLAVAATAIGLETSEEFGGGVASSASIHKDHSCSEPTITDTRDHPPGERLSIFAKQRTDISPSVAAASYRRLKVKAEKQAGSAQMSHLTPPHSPTHGARSSSDDDSAGAIRKQSSTLQRIALDSSDRYLAEHPGLSESDLNREWRKSVMNSKSQALSVADRVKSDSTAEGRQSSVRSADRLGVMPAPMGFSSSHRAHYKSAVHRAPSTIISSDEEYYDEPPKAFASVIDDDPSGVVPLQSLVDAPSDRDSSSDCYGPGDN